MAQLREGPRSLTRTTQGGGELTAYDSDDDDGNQYSVHGAVECDEERLHSAKHARAQLRCAMVQFHPETTRLSALPSITTIGRTTKAIDAAKRRIPPEDH